MSKKICYKDENGINQYLSLYETSYCQTTYSDNTNITPLTQNVWAKFAFPSNGWSPGNPSKDFTVSETEVKFTYTGTPTKLFDLSGVCNMYKANGGATTRDVEFCWYLNGVQYGTVRGHKMDTERNIVTGSGIIELSTGDYIEPMFRNTESADDVKFVDCIFKFVEIPRKYFGFV